MKSMLDTLPAINSIAEQKTYYNVGCLADIPTGQYVRGMRGENILNGGHGAFMGLVGKNNLFKSTIMHFMSLTAAHSVAVAGYRPYISTYDTETNIHLNRLVAFAKGFPMFRDIDMFDEKIWLVSDVNEHMGDEWFSLLREFLRNVKIKQGKKRMMDTPFVNKKGEPIQTLYPTFGQLDSVTKFTTASVAEIQNKNNIGDSSRLTEFMRQGLVKAQLLAELPIMCGAAAHYMIATAHVTQENLIGVPQHQMPTKKLQHMKQGEKIKGAPDDFFFMTNALWQACTASALSHPDTRGPLYPAVRGQDDAGNPDLNLVNLKLLRNKSGPSGGTIQVLVSQVDGVLPRLTEFHYIKEADRFGLDGNNTTYHLAIRPSVNLTRTSVRETIDNDPRTARAVKITSDLLQIKNHYKALPMVVPEPGELYAKLEKKYGWDKLLDTRDFWTFDQYENKVPFLSTLDLIEMYHDAYVPYFLK